MGHEMLSAPGPWAGPVANLRSGCRQSPRQGGSAAGGVVLFIYKLTVSEFGLNGNRPNSPMREGRRRLKFHKVLTD